MAITESNYRQEQGGSTEPREGYTPCPQCWNKRQGILIEKTITVRHSAEPDEPISKATQCGVCGWYVKRWILPAQTHTDPHTGERTVYPSTAQKYGVTKDMLRRCLKAAPKCDSFTVKELKGEAALPKSPGYDEPQEQRYSPKPMDYNPDGYIEPKGGVLDGPLF